jgi:hypothetical protein
LKSNGLGQNESFDLVYKDAWEEGKEKDDSGEFNIKYKNLEELAEIKRSLFKKDTSKSYTPSSKVN